jgi:hypothetical protein
MERGSLVSVALPSHNMLVDHKVDARGMTATKVKPDEKMLTAMQMNDEPIQQAPLLNLAAPERVEPLS